MYQARHSTRSTGQRKAVRASVATAAVAAGAAGAVMGAAPASADIYSQIRNCESGGNYSTNTGNGFYGAYQFTQSTWSSLGYGGSPAGASPATQDAAAQQLAARSGFGQWPVCGAGGGSATAPAATYSTPAYSAPTYSAPVQQYYAPAASRSFQRTTLATSSPYLTTALVGQVRQDVRSYQQSLANLHYAITVDGQFGPQTQAVTEKFQHDQGLQVDGIAGPLTLHAAGQQ